MQVTVYWGSSRHGVYPALYHDCSFNLFPDVSSAALLAPSGLGLGEARKLTKTARPENTSYTKYPLFKFDELMLSLVDSWRDRVLAEVLLGRWNNFIGFFLIFQIHHHKDYMGLHSCTIIWDWNNFTLLVKATKSRSHDWFLFEVK